MRAEVTSRGVSPLLPARVAVAVALLVDPALAAARATDAARTRGETALARVLAIRMLVQAATLDAHPTPTRLRLGVAIDAAHGLSMGPLALASPPYRRLGVTNVALMAAFVVAGLRQIASPRRLPATGGSARPAGSRWPD